MKYMVVSDTNLETMVNQVCDLIVGGWQPQGGIAVRPATAKYDGLFVQAMIMTDEEEELQAAVMEEMANLPKLKKKSEPFDPNKY